MPNFSLAKFNIDIKKKSFFLCVFWLVAVRLWLASQQLIYIAPDLSATDDTLMFNLANSISNGNWLGEYDWLALSKHSFYALWLSALSFFKINVIVGGQALFALAALVTVQALAPVLKSAPRLALFAFLLFIPSSYAQFTLRIYRDNIYPSLVLLALSALIGAYLRYKQPFERAVGWVIISGLGFGAAWLTHEDNALLIPFFVCASLVYVLFVYKSKAIKKKAKSLALIAVPVLICIFCNFAWAYMNFTHYGRFVVSDFTSKEFSDAMGALSRANPDAQERYILVPYETRQMLYEVSPSFALLKPYLETEQMYGGYGSPQDKEIFSGGIHWAVRVTAAKAGFYENAQKAAQFYSAVAAEINAACDSGVIPSSGKQSGVFSPIKAKYIMPTLEKFGESLSVFLFFTQTSPTSDLSIANPEAIEQWHTYLNTQSTYRAVANTTSPYFEPSQRLVAMIYECITWIYRLLIFPIILLCGIYCTRACKKIFIQLKSKSLSVGSMAAIFMLGLFLTGILRFAAVAYLSAVSLKIATLDVGVYIMYLAPAYAPILAFLGFGAINALIKEENEEVKV